MRSLPGARVSWCGCGGTRHKKVDSRKEGSAGQVHVTGLPRGSLDGGVVSLADGKSQVQKTPRSSARARGSVVCSRRLERCASCAEQRTSAGEEVVLSRVTSVERPCRQWHIAWHESSATPRRKGLLMTSSFVYVRPAPSGKHAQVR